jgi:hypothetical protein
MTAQEAAAVDELLTHSYACTFRTGSVAEQFAALGAFVREGSLPAGVQPAHAARRGAPALA